VTAPARTAGQAASEARLALIRDGYLADSDEYAALDAAVDRVEAAADCLRGGGR